tara:strand:+ start:150 stop:2435 length:2286 start_codon:yes stop_codon:yes gene_type:complete
MKIKNLLICLIIITIYSCSNSDNDFGRVIQEPKKPENPLELYVYHLIELSYFLDQFKLYYKEDGKWISKFGNDFTEIEPRPFPRDERLVEKPHFNLGRKVKFKFDTEWYNLNDGIFSISEEYSVDINQDSESQSVTNLNEKENNQIIKELGTSSFRIRINNTVKNLNIRNNPINGDVITKISGGENYTVTKVFETSEPTHLLKYKMSFKDIETGVEIEKPADYKLSNLREIEDDIFYAEIFNTDNTVNKINLEKNNFKIEHNNWFFLKELNGWMYSKFGEKIVLKEDQVYNKNIDNQTKTDKSSVVEDPLNSPYTNISNPSDVNEISFEEVIEKYNLNEKQIHYYISQHILSIEVCGCMEGDELFEGEVEYYVKNGSPWEQKFSKYQESQSLSFIDFPFFNSQFLSHEKMNLIRVLKLLQPGHFKPPIIYYQGAAYDLRWYVGFSPAYQWNSSRADLQEIMKELKRIVSNLESLSNEILSEDFNESIKLDLHNRQVNTQIVDFEHGIQDTLYLLGGSLNNNKFYPFDADGIITALQQDGLTEYEIKKLDYTLPNNNINDLSNTLASLKKPYDVINKDDVFTFSKNLTVERVDQFANNLGIIVEEVKSWKKEDIMTDLIGQTFTGTVSGMGHQLETSCQITVYEYEGWARFEVYYSVTTFSGNTSSSIEKYELKIPSRYNNEESGVSGRDIVKFENGKYGVSFPVKSLTEGGVEYGKGSRITIFINTKGNLQLSLGNNNHSYNAVADVSSSRLFEMLTKINE